MTSARRHACPMNPEPTAATRELDVELQRHTALLGKARALLHASHIVPLQQILRGKKLALLCIDSQSEEARLFEKAATQLGAHVACVRVNLSDASSDAIVGETASLLSRLYDAVECLDMTPALTDRLRRAASIPVLVGATASPQDAPLLTSMLMAEGCTASDAQRLGLQARLAIDLA